VSILTPLLFYLFLLATYAGWGSWFLRLLPEKDNLPLAASILSLGVALVGIVFTLAYFGGVPTLAVLWGSTAVSSGGLAYALILYRRENALSLRTSKAIATLAARPTARDILRASEFRFRTRGRQRRLSF